MPRGSQGAARPSASGAHRSRDHQRALRRREPAGVRRLHAAQGLYASGAVTPSSLAGVDGCRTGWVAAIDRGDGRTRVQWFAEFVHILECAELAIVAVDIPIGLLQRSPRACDVLARKLLGPRRGSSVFPAPIRAMLESATWEEACAIRAASEGKRCSRQAFLILAKIRSVDRAMTPEAQARVVEVHPEVCFATMTGEGPIAMPKRSAPGRRERERRLGKFFPDLHEHAHRRPGAQPDDVLDAY